MNEFARCSNIRPFYIKNHTKYAQKNKKSKKTEERACYKSIQMIFPILQLQLANPKIVIHPLLHSEMLQERLVSGVGPISQLIAVLTIASV